MTTDQLNRQELSNQNTKGLIAHCFNVRANFRDIFIRKSGRYAALDGIRALSVLAVVFFHAAMPALEFYELETMKGYLRNFPIADKWLFEGHYGVNAFFVLSGFLIGTMLMKEIDRSQSINLKQFYLRRYLRLSPLYFFVLALIASFWVFGANQSANDLWFNVLYINNYVIDAHLKMPWAWSLAVEEQFYLIFPLLLLLVFRFNNKLKILIGIYLFSYLVRALLLANNPELLLDLSRIYFSKELGTHEEATSFVMLLYIPLWSRFGELIIGVLVAYMNLYHGDKLKAVLQKNIVLNNILLIAALAAITWLVSVPIYDIDMKLSNEFLFFYNTINENLFSLCVAIIMCCVLYPAGLSCIADKILSANFWYPIAQLSYAIYLLHPPFVYFFGFLPAAKGSTVPSLGIYLQAGFIGLLVTLLFAAITFIFIERPFMKMRDLRRTPPPMRDAKPPSAA